MAATGGRGISLMEAFYPPVGNGGILSNFMLDNAADALEILLVMRGGYDGGALTRLGFRQGSLTGVAPVFRVSLQGIGANGYPNGTIKGASNLCYFDYTPTSGNNSTWQWVTMGETYTPAPGEPLYVVIQRFSGTIDASNKCSFTSQMASVGRTIGFFSTVSNDAGSRTRSINYAVGAVGSATAVYGQPIETQYSTALTSATTPDELAAKFTLPAAWGSTYQIGGLGVQCGTNVSVGGTTTIKLYDTDGSTVLQSATFDHDIEAGEAGPNKWYQYIPFDETTLSTLNFGSAYRIAVCPDGAVAFSPAGFDVDAAADLDAYALGQLCHGSSRTNAGAWTDEPARRYGIAPWIVDWTVPTAGVGVVVQQAARRWWMPPAVKRLKAATIAQTLLPAPVVIQRHERRQLDTRTYPRRPPPIIVVPPPQTNLIIKQDRRVM